ncbi:membrane-anchored cyclic-di-GMP phosphodiesterase [Escherichia coli]|nr:membrane-anchored cyclic-di-GMP phosphodiesterase [Escherichia coli]
MSGSAFAVTHHAFSSGAGRTSDGNGSHASTLKSPSYTKSVSWQHYRVFEDMGDWLRQHSQQHISINLESTVLTSEKIPQLLREMINHYQVNPRQIALELTEREFADPKTSAPIISRYREAGHEIYLDDFGTGYSSLSYLQDLDVDILKIDKSFVDALEYKNVTPHIIEMAKTLKLKMVAEGIETSKQEEWLRQHGVHYGQGWLYSKALPKEDFLRWAEQHL